MDIIRRQTSPIKATRRPSIGQAYLAVSLAILVVEIGQASALFGLGSNAVGRANKILAGLTSSESVSSNQLALGAYDYKANCDARTIGLLNSLLALEWPLDDASKCSSDYARVLLNYRTSLEQIVGPKLLYGKKTAGDRLVGILNEYTESYYKLCEPALVDSCNQVASGGEESEQKIDLFTSSLLKLYHFCSGSLVKKQQKLGTPAPLARLECALADYELVSRGERKFSQRLVEIGETLLALHQHKTGSVGRPTLADLERKPKLVEQLYREHLLEPCKLWLEDTSKRGIASAVSLVRAPAFSEQKLGQLPAVCVRNIRKAMMCNMIMDNLTRELVNKIAAV